MFDYTDASVAAERRITHSGRTPQFDIRPSHMQIAGSRNWANAMSGPHVGLSACLRNTFLLSERIGWLSR